MTTPPGGRVRLAAADKTAGLTLGELREFLRLADRVAMPDTAPLTCTDGWLERHPIPTLEVHRDTVTSITCPRCNRTSHHPDDIAQGYCSHCHDWTSR